MNSLRLLWKMNLLVFKNTVREHSLSVYLEKILVHDLLNIFILTSLSLLGSGWNGKLLLHSMPYFVFLIFFSSALTPWQSECWNKISSQLRSNSVYLVLSRGLTAFMFAFPTWILFFVVITVYSEQLLRDYLFLILYAFSGVFIGAATGLLTNLKNEKTISNFAQAAIWVLALGKSPFLSFDGINYLLAIFPGALIDVNPILEGVKIVTIMFTIYYFIKRRDCLVYER